MATRPIILTIALSLAICASVAGGVTYRVATDGNDNADGLSWATAFKTIQKGIDVSSHKDDIVEVNKGTYYENLLISNEMLRNNIQYPYSPKNGIIRSVNPNDWNVVAATIIDGNGADTVVNLSLDVSARLKGFTITGGQFGIFFEKGAKAVVSNCIVRNNKTAGVAVYQSTPTIMNSIIHNNGYQGIRAQYVYLTAKNNIIYGNNEGIAIKGPYTTGILRNNTITDNKSYGIKTSDANVSASNCILWNNGFDLSGCRAAYSCIKNTNDANGVGNISSDPCFVDAGGNNFHIGVRSPCVNAGDPGENYANQVDIDGDPRVIGERADIGADEVRAQPPDANTAEKK